MIKIKKIDVMSLGKIMGIMYIIMGFFIGAMFSLTALFFNYGMPLWYNLFFGIGAIIFLPVFYGIMGFIMGLLCAVIYNSVSSKIGGLEVETGK